MPPDKVPGTEVAHEQIGIGDRRLGPAPPVAGRSRDGARRPGPDAEPPAGVDRRDAAAARAHLGQIDHRDLDRIAPSPAQAPATVRPADMEVVRDIGLALADDAGLGRGATHVEGEHPVGADEPADHARGDDPGGSAGLHRVDRPPGGHARRTSPRRSTP